VQPRVQGNFRDDSFPWKFNKFVAVRKILSSEIDGFLKVSNTGAFTLQQLEIYFDSTHSSRQNQYKINLKMNVLIFI
jgi:hypothetical protein